MNDNIDDDDEDDNEFSYSFWLEQHRIMEEKRDSLREQLAVAKKALHHLWNLRYNNTILYHNEIASEALKKIEEIRVNNEKKL